MKIKKTKRTYQLTMSHDEFEALSFIVEAGESEWMHEPREEGSRYEIADIANRSIGVQDMIDNLPFSHSFSRALNG
jgi:hypothetical protein